ncbi:MAG TPA: endolytic transglycosylase MltG [Anaerolineales bacterium]|nr:endolytic transglycosylase MltG [Anaerolineales bacterium]
MRKLIIIFFFLIILICLFLTFITIPSQAEKVYGQPASWLTFSQRVQYSARLLWHDGLLTRPLDTNGSEQSFIIESGESVNSIANKLELTGFIRDAVSFRDYLVYAGLDTSIQAGTYKLSAAMSAIDIAHELQDATSTEVTFVVLPGWRMEEIASILPSSGLTIDPNDFFFAVTNPPNGFEFLASANSAEGFLHPDSYIFSRETTADELVNELVRQFSLRLSREMQLGFEDQGLTVYQAVTIASIVEKEAVQKEEAPLIASVYINRLNVGMKLEADPTVQYAIGYNALQNTWWTNPLSVNNLQFDSPFNTYVYAGLPPSPISNPGFDALNAVAFPAETPYYFFRAKCDGTGYHTFAVTFEEHLGNGCE